MPRKKKKKLRPGANLYNNNDGTYSGRVSSAPFEDFQLTCKSKEPLTLALTKGDVFTQGQVGGEFTFRPSSASAMMGGDDDGAGRLVASQEDPTVVLRIRTSGPTRFRVERHIQNDAVSSGSIADAFASSPI